MTIRDYTGKVLPATHNVHILYPWGSNSRTVTLQPKVALGKQPIVQQLDDWIKRRVPGNSVIGYIITRGRSIHIYMDTDYMYNFARWNPDLADEINHDGGGKMKDNPSYHVTRLYAGRNIRTGKWSRPYLCGADWRVKDTLTDYRGCITAETDTGWGDYADCVIYCIAEMTPSGLQLCQRKICTVQDLLDYAKALADKEREQEKFLNTTDEEPLELINS